MRIVILILGIACFLVSGMESARKRKTGVLEFVLCLIGAWSVMYALGGFDQ